MVMTGLVPNVAEAQMARLVLNASTDGPENVVLRLFKNDLTLSSTQTLADFTEATFTGYASVTVSSSQWTVTPGGGGELTSAIHVSTSGVAFTCSAATSEAIYGSYLTGAATSTLMWAERFDSAPFTVTSSGDALMVRPRLLLYHNKQVWQELVSYYGCESISSGKITTSATTWSTLDLTNFSCTISTDGKNGNALAIAPGQYAYRTGFPTSSPHSFAMWAKYSTETTAFANFAGTTTGSTVVMLAVQGSAFGIYYAPYGIGGFNSGSIGRSADTYYHLAFVWTGSEHRLYVNGKIDLNISGNMDGAASEFLLNGQPACGKTITVDEVAYFSEALDANRIARLAAGTYYST